MSDDYYTTLGVSKTATDDEIKKSYRKLAIVYHPDKAPADKKDEHTKTFQKISEAYEVLSDAEKRKIYNERGKEGLTNAGQQAQQQAQQQQMNDMLSSMFGFKMGPQQPQQRKNADTAFHINLTLREAYTGCVKKLKITKKAITHKGSVVKDNLENTWTTCPDCNGQGAIIRTIQQGNMIQQIHQQCAKCSTNGSVLKKEYELKEVTDMLNINIPKGVQNGEQHRFANQGNCAPGTLTGDIVVVINVEQTGNGFTRSGNDLLYTQPILLSEALCGGNFQLILLDDKVINVSFEKVAFDVKSETKTINGLGINGNLLINFNIQFPQLDDSQKDALRKILPQPAQTPKNENIGYKV